MPELAVSGISTTGLVAYYKFDNGAITTDSSGNSKTLTNNNTVGGTASGIFGYAANYGNPNTNKYLSRADALGVDLSSTFSVNLWVNILAQPGAGNLFGLCDWRSTTGTGRYINVYYQYASPGVYAMGCNHAESYIGLGSLVFSTSDWYMVTAVCDGTKIGLYLNGQRIGENAKGTAANASNYTDIGRITAYYTPANFDDVSFWNRCLSDVEISSLYGFESNRIILV